VHQLVRPYREFSTTVRSGLDDEHEGHRKGEHQQDLREYQKVPSITFTGPNGWKYSSRVEDRKALVKVKVGDTLDITWTEAMILSLDDGK
jgi:hypothetical protein